MKIYNKVTFADGFYTLTVSLNGKLYGSTVAAAIQVKGDDPQNVLDRSKILIKEMSSLGLEEIKKTKIENNGTS